MLRTSSGTRHVPVSLFEHKPTTCPYGHALGPGRAWVSWTPCICTPARETAVKAADEVDLSECPERERTLRASVLRKIMLSHVGDEQSPGGVRLRSAVIDGDLVRGRLVS